jgi:hypothetical protein
MLSTWPQRQVPPPAHHNADAIYHETQRSNFTRGGKVGGRKEFGSLDFHGFGFCHDPRLSLPETSPVGEGYQ